MVALAVSRFDVWSRRGLSVVRSREALRDYEQWLATYIEHWVAYVADTCPRVVVGDPLRTKLAARARYWADEAQRALADSL